MRCPICQHFENRVLESRSADSGQSVRRRRECLKCTYRFTTYERVEISPIMVIKRNGQRELFEQLKLSRGVTRACEKSGISDSQLEQVISTVELALQQRSVREITSVEIGELVLDQLQLVSEVAYIRFASVYSQFQGLDDFLKVLDQLRSLPNPDET
jgi:transcriptional repressor NrdR